MKGPFRKKILGKDGKLYYPNGQAVLAPDQLLSVHKITQPISFGKSNRFADIKDPYYLDKSKIVKNK